MKTRKHVLLSFNALYLSSCDTLTNTPQCQCNIAAGYGREKLFYLVIYIANAENRFIAGSYPFFHS